MDISSLRSCGFAWRLLSRNTVSSARGVATPDEAASASDINRSLPLLCCMDEVHTPGLDDARGHGPSQSLGNHGPASAGCGFQIMLDKVMDWGQRGKRFGGVNAPKNGRVALEVASAAGFHNLLHTSLVTHLLSPFFVEQT